MFNYIIIQLILTCNFSFMKPSLYFTSQSAIINHLSPQTYLFFFSLVEQYFSRSIDWKAESNLNEFLNTWICSTASLTSSCHWKICSYHLNCCTPASVSAVITLKLMARSYFCSFLMPSFVGSYYKLFAET